MLREALAVCLVAVPAIGLGAWLLLPVPPVPAQSPAMKASGAAREGDGWEARTELPRFRDHNPLPRFQVQSAPPALRPAGHHVP